MKLNLRIIFLSAVFVILFGAANISFAQTVVIPTTGGYSTAETNDNHVKAAAAFAIKARAKQQKAKIKLTGVKKAEKQVVAGVIFRLCLQIESKEKNQKTAVPQIVEAIVYSDLKFRLSLTSWAIAACSEETIPLPKGK